MNVLTARNLFREYVDDPDANFVTDTQANRFLEFGLEEWRNKIRQTAPHLLMVATKFQDDTNATNYANQPASAKPFKYALDLNDDTMSYVDTSGVKQTGVFMGPDLTPGPAATYGPVDMVLNVYDLDSADPSRLKRCRPVPDMETFMNSVHSYNYVMNGYVLQFRGDFPDEFLIEYFPRKATDFTVDSEEIAQGKLDIWHELIVLMATKRYFIKDGVGNQILFAEYARQVEMFDQYLIQSFNNKAQQRVSVDHLF